MICLVILVSILVSLWSIVTELSVITSTTTVGAPASSFGLKFDPPPETALIAATAPGQAPALTLEDKRNQKPGAEQPAPKPAEADKPEPKPPEPPKKKWWKLF